MNSLPIVGVTAEPKILIEGPGNRASFVFSLSQPAPVGGLTLNVGFIEEDGAGGDDDAETENITSFELNALGLTSSITIEEGATEAKLTAVSLGDDILEDDESSTLFILETPTYDVDPNASEATIIETDVPVVSLSVEAPTIDANGAGIFQEGPGNSASFVFSLSKPAPAGGLILNLATFEQDGAFGDDTISTENLDSFSENALGTIGSVTISEGATEARLTLNSIGDDIPEGPEETTLFLLEAIGYTPNPDASEATLIETDVSPNVGTISVSIDPEIVIATEGETFGWNFSLDQPAPAGGLSLFLPITVNNDPAPGDVAFLLEDSSNISDFEFVVEGGVSVGFSLTIAEGATEATLVSEAIADDITEIDEISTTVIADGENYRVNPEQNQVTTILTEFPVVSLVSEEVTAAEGETFTWNFSVNQPAPAGGLSLFLPITVNNDPAPGDVAYFIEGSSNISDFEFVVADGVSVGFSLTIAEGATEATLVSQAVADDLVEGEENFTTAIADGENYRANPAQSQVVTNLLDVVTDLPIVSLSVEPDIAVEDGQASIIFHLSEPAPVGGLVVNFLVEDSDPNLDTFIFNSADSSNIVDFQNLFQDGDTVASQIVTIAEGATTATLVQDIPDDGLAEDPEFLTYTLDTGEGYTIDSSNNSDRFTLIDSVASDGDDTIHGTSGPDVIDGEGGNDRIRGGRGDDSLSGSDGNDRISGQAGDDTLLGGNGDDKLFGEAGDDVIHGGGGDDFIFGWKGDDAVSGGAGSDRFVLAPGHGTDTIADFTVGEDSIGLKQGLTYADLSVTANGTNTEIALGSETLAILNGVTDPLTAADFMAIG